MYPRTDYLDENPVILAESLRAALASERALSERYFTYWQTAVKRIKELEDA